MVDLLSRLNSLRVKRDSRLDLPTPESPITTTATARCAGSYGGATVACMVASECCGGDRRLRTARRAVGAVAMVGRRSNAVWRSHEQRCALRAHP